MGGAWKPLASQHGIVSIWCSEGAGEQAQLASYGL